jgi:hypothetical protein
MLVKMVLTSLGVMGGSSVEEGIGEDEVSEEMIDDDDDDDDAML